MRTIFFLFLIILVSSCTSQETKSPKLKLMTFNILGGRNVDGKRDLQRVADVINKFKPDFVALQEVDVKTNRIRKVDVPAELAKVTGMHSAFGEAMPYDGGSYGEAVLSKYPIIESKNYKLPALKGAEPRAALTVKSKVPGFGEIYFTGTHLDHVRKDTSRMIQAKAINEIYKNGQGIHFMAGDLNTTPNSAVMKELYKTYEDCWKNDKKGLD